MSDLLCPICGKNVQSVNVTPDCQHTTLEAEYAIREIFEYANELKAKLDVIVLDRDACAKQRDALRKQLITYAEIYSIFDDLTELYGAGFENYRLDRAVEELEKILTKLKAQNAISAD